MAHIINVTPEAHTLEDAFNGSEPVEKITFGQRELGEVYQTFTPTTRRVDVVNINLSVRKLYKTVRILRGRKTHKDVRLLLDAPLAVRAVADQYGLRTQIEAAGGLLRDSGIPRLWSEARKLGIRTVVTDDAKNCHYLGQQGVEPALRPLQECIDAAITGRLEDH
jgi:predicted aconitase